MSTVSEVRPGWTQWAAAAVWSTTVVVANELREHCSQVSFTEDQHTIGEFCSGGQYEPFGEAVRPRAARRDLHHAYEQVDWAVRAKRHHIEDHRPCSPFYLSLVSLSLGPQSQCVGLPQEITASDNQVTAPAEVRYGEPASSVRPLTPGAKLFHTNEISTLYPQ